MIKTRYIDRNLLVKEILDKELPKEASRIKVEMAIYGQSVSNALSERSYQAS